MNPSRIYLWSLTAVIFIFLLFVPKFLPEMKIHLIIEILIFALFAVSFNLTFGYGGLLAFGFGALFGTGAYASALTFKLCPAMPLLAALAIAALSGLAAAIFIGSLSVRLKGAYFSLSTFAFQMFFYAIALKWRSVTNGDDGIGITRPELYLPVLGNLSMMNTANLYYLILILAALGIIGAYLLLKTPFGNSIVCIRENEFRAAFLGYNVFFIKVATFSASGFLAGMAGGCFVLFNEFISTNCIDFQLSFTVTLMAIIGGTGHFLGPVLGAAFYIGIQDWLSSLTQRWWLVMGILFIFAVLYMPAGLMSLFQSIKFRFLRIPGKSR
jgi:branched-chain amino acid transport system permease protein